MPRILLWIILLTVLLQSEHARSTGWNDYELEIDGGFSILRPYSGCHGLVAPNGQVILTTEELGGVSQFVGWSATTTHIFLECERGSMTRTASNPTALYLIVDQSSHAASKLLTLHEFEKDPAVVSAVAHNWKSVRNPNFFLPLIGAVCFLILSVVIFVPMILPLLAMPFVLLWYLLHRRQHCDQ